MVPDPTERRAVRALFAAVVIGLLAQWFVHHKFGEEPYPAILMPGFGGAGGHSSEGVDVRWLEVDLVDADGTVVPVPIDELLATIPRAVRGTLPTKFLGPLPEGYGEEDGPDIPPGLRYRLLPGLHNATRNRHLPETRESLRAYLAARAEAIAPGRAFDRVEFRWFQDTLRITEDGISRTREPLGVRVISLQQGASP